MQAAAGRMFRRCFLILQLALLLALVGCGSDGERRYELAGTVNFAGKPIPAGIIYFDPDLASGQDGPQGYAPITNGKYDTRAEGLGPGSGKYVFRLYACDGIPANELLMGKPLFPEYSWNETLPAEDSVKNIEVPASAARVAAAPAGP